MAQLLTIIFLVINYKKVIDSVNIYSIMGFAGKIRIHPDWERVGSYYPTVKPPGY